MPAIDETMGRMLVRIVEQAAGVGVSACFCRIPGIPPRRPGAVMRLEPNSSSPARSAILSNLSESGLAAALAPDSAFDCQSP